ncbi:hypothetical protein DMENIID0001_141100 [Sergentomyia squamirostris]
MDNIKQIDIEILQNSAPYSSPSFAAPSNSQHFPPHFIPQQPSMFGIRGTTIPPRFLPRYQHPSARRGNFNHYNQPRGDVWCEMCDRSFCNAVKLEQHKAEHEKCGIDGCFFEAHPGVLQRHRDMQHNTGLFSKLQNLETDEEIAKWREERRRNYPTVKNVELRRKAQEEKIKRGERIPERKGRFGERHNKSDNNSRNQGRKKRRNQRSHKVRDSAEKMNQEEKKAEIELNQGVPMFKGTAELEDFAPLKENPLALLLSAYGSDSGNENEEKTSEIPSCSKNASPEKISTNVGTPSQQLDSPELIPKEKEQNKRPPKRNPSAKTITSSSKKAKRSYEGLNYGFLRRRQPATMLSKLLEGEIRHERNVLLQCVRYVVQNNFLEDKKDDL